MEIVKEKLMKLLRGSNCPDGRTGSWLECNGCKYESCPDCYTERNADYLIQNGVTSQEWVSVDEPPTKEGWYHVAILDMKTGKYRVENDLYAIEIARMHNHEPGFCKAKSWPERDKLTHWCPYPQPPKEVHHA